MAGGAKVPVLVSRDGGKAFVKPMGACTIAIWATVRHALKGLGRPACTDLYFDLSAADVIDSTFTGFLCSMATEKNNPAVPKIHLLQPSRSVCLALERMHVLGLFDVCKDMDPPDEWDEVSQQNIPNEELTRLVIDAHEELIKADGRNAASFGPLVTTLRNSVAQT